MSVESWHRLSKFISPKMKRNLIPSESDIQAIIEKQIVESIPTDKAVEITDLVNNSVNQGMKGTDVTKAVINIIYSETKKYNVVKTKIANKMYLQRLN